MHVARAGRGAAGIEVIEQSLRLRTEDKGHDSDLTCVIAIIPAAWKRFVAFPREQLCLPGRSQQPRFHDRAQSSTGLEEGVVTSA